MDTHNPALNLTYMETCTELEDHSIHDAVDVYSLPAVLLATLGGMDDDHATQLQQYVQDHVLHPLGLMYTGGGRTSGSVGGSSSHIDTALIEGEKKELTLTRKYKKSQEDIIHWVETVTQGESGSEEVDELQADADEEDEGESEDDAASQEV